MKRPYNFIEKSDNGFGRYYRVRQVYASNRNEAVMMIQYQKHNFGYQIIAQVDSANEGFESIKTRIKLDARAGIRSVLSVGQVVGL